MNKKILFLVYSLTAILGFMTLYFLAYPIEPMRTQSMYALLSEIFFLIGFGFIIGTGINFRKKTHEYLVQKEEEEKEE